MKNFRGWPLYIIIPEKIWLTVFVNLISCTSWQWSMRKYTGPPQNGVNFLGHQEGKWLLTEAWKMNSFFLVSQSSHWSVELDMLTATAKLKKPEATWQHLPELWNPPVQCPPHSWLCRWWFHIPLSLPYVTTIISFSIHLCLSSPTSIYTRPSQPLPALLQEHPY